jgi:3-deoxy-7-phosphoheptulonate synthase
MLERMINIMKHNTDDLRIQKQQELITPNELISQQPCNEIVSEIVYQSRKDIHRILHGMDDRLIVIIGPCSIHDTNAAIEYAKQLVNLQVKYKQDLHIIMRVYFEKPRTNVGWKGLINDPYLDGSFKINEGLKLARSLLVQINSMGLSAATEFLDVISPQYICDLISWGAIGARTTESQIHRELASGLSCPVGFKNGTDGNVKIAIDAIKSASGVHHFLSVTKDGKSAIYSTSGNEDCHVILRGGKEPNYDKESIQKIASELGKSGISSKIMVDVSHANSQKKHENQILVCDNISEQISAGEDRIIGLMIESNLVSGRQDHIQGHAVENLIYGQSITDACIDMDSSAKILQKLAIAVRQRKLNKENQG